jgi:UDP-GlcNAc:undecaprenyl-phosphate GlcNAc-1-phosphate transferase
MSGWYLVLIAATCALVSAVVTWVVVKYGSKLGIIDDPKKHIHPKVVHTQPVPRGGGIPILASLVVGAVIWMPWDARTAGIVGGAIILAMWGWLDDKFEEQVSPYVRLVLGNAAAALTVVGTGIGVAYVASPWGGVIHLDVPRWCFGLVGSEHCVWILADLVAILWLVGMQNIVGWSSGVDGQLPAFVVVAAIAVGLVAGRFWGDPSQLPVMILAAITAGAYLGFLPWNWFPQKIMPGYGGKSLAGFLLGVLAILSYAKFGAMIMVLGIPVVDAVMVVLKRIRERRSIFMGGREHMHHYLLDMGWSKPVISIFYTSMSILFAWLALTLKPETKLFTMAAVVLIVGGTILWLQNWSTYSKQADRDSGLKT